MNPFIVITGPSGSGKTTTLDKLLKEYPNEFEFHKSYTTRNPREIVDYNYYHFVNIEDFFDKIRNNELIEWEEIYSNSYYGTPKSGLLKSKKIKVLIKDVKGAKFLKRLYGKNCFLVYLRTDTIEVLKERLRHDGNRNDLEERLTRIEYENSFSDLDEDCNIDTVKNSVLSVVNKIFDCYKEKNS